MSGLAADFDSRGCNPGNTAKTRKRTRISPNTIRIYAEVRGALAFAPRPPKVFDLLCGWAWFPGVALGSRAWRQLLQRFNSPAVEEITQRLARLRIVLETLQQWFQSGDNLAAQD